MAEIIDFAELQAARRRASAHAVDRHHLECAVQILRENLAVAAAMLAAAPAPEREELLTRVERLATMVRYGMRMLGESNDPGLDGSAPISQR
ncbi:MAG TPA: hypothetical protein VMT58_09895 [Candidatus Binataceae bacterium]|nr:hypothetical protein [Candidatus Binataceae bacterium]